MKKAKVNEMVLTEEQKKELKGIHNWLFRLNMDSIMVQRQAEPYKVERVQALFTEKVVDYIPDFWNGNDTIIFAD